MNHNAAHVICDHPEHPAAREAASQIIMQWASDMSEECWAASWMQGIEVDLYRLVQAGGGEWGMGEVTPEDAATVRALIEVGGWFGSDRRPIPAGHVAAWWAANGVEP